MTPDELSKVLNVVRQLQAKQTILTGSAALYNYGLITNLPNDVDIILVDPTEEVVKQLKLLESTSPATGRVTYPDCMNKNSNGNTRSYGIKILGIDVDFFIMNKEQSVSVTYLGMYLARIDNIYQVKGYYSRKKDSQSLLSAIGNLMNNYNLGSSTKEMEDKMVKGIIRNTSSLEDSEFGVCKSLDQEK